MYINKKELLQKIQKRFTDLDNNRGCYLDGVWFSISSIVYIINENYYDCINKEVLLDNITAKYGNLNNDRGCYLDGVWFSIASVVETVNACYEYNDYKDCENCFY